MSQRPSLRKTRIPKVVGPIRAGVVLSLWAATALGAPAGANLDLPSQSLSASLSQLARMGRNELVFDRSITDAKRAPGLKGRFTTEQALAIVLAGSGLTWRRTADGGYFVTPTASAGPAANAAEDKGDGAVSELLVMGRRNLNTGIRRSRDDIQPYDIAGDDALMQSGGENLEGFMRARMPANAQAASNIQAPVANIAATRSSLNLLGLGTDQTLVLVDGRRLPGVPNPFNPYSSQINTVGLAQPDVNGIPLAAIERVEVLTSTAGALYGPGATGGVVNVILKRDYQGASVSFTQGLSGRGDAPQTRFDGQIGFSSADGLSGLALTVGLSRSDGLRLGDRAGYVIEGRARRLAVAGKYTDLPVGRDINISAISGTLTLDPAYGGQSLNATRTHYSASGFTQAEAIANAGTLDLSLAPNAFGATQSMLTETRTASFILSGRRQFGSIETYFDALQLETWGRATGPAGDAAIGPISATSPYNPFQQSVLISVPLPWAGALRSHVVTRRLTAGIIFQLPHRWRASLDGSYSHATVRASDDRRQQNLFAFVAGLDFPGATTPYGPSVSPFWDQAQFLDAYGYYRSPVGVTYKRQDRLQTATLRAAGPLMSLPGGPLTMTVQAEARIERVPLGVRYGWDPGGAAYSQVGQPGLSETTGSLVGEWRAPIVSMQTPGVLRGLEAQLSLRADRYRSRAPIYADVLAQGLQTYLGTSVFKGQDDVVAKTVGLRTFLLPELMARMSFADGYLPTTSQQLSIDLNEITSSPFHSLADPKRGGAIIGNESSVGVLLGGTPKLGAEKAQTASLGLVYKPRAWPGARLSVDYLRTDKSREVADYLRNDRQYFIDHEAQYPDRVVRAPLTDGDRLKGYTAGRILYIDTTAMNVGRSVVKSVDVSADYQRDLDAETSVRGYLSLTWQPTYRRRGDPTGPWYETAGRADGPLKVRGNAGLEWTRGRSLIGVNLQYLDGRDVAASGFDGADDAAAAIARQQASRLPSQTYVDLVLRRTFGADGQNVAQLVVRNLADTRMPIDANFDLGYSRYGDPRGRRFELTLTRQF